MDNLAPIAADKEQNYNSERDRETSRPDFAEATRPEFTLVSEVWISGRFERHGRGSLGGWASGVGTGSWGYTRVWRLVYLR